MRHLPNTEKEIQKMLEVVGVSKVEDLFKSIPTELRSKTALSISDGMNEMDLSSHMTSIAMKNRTLSCSASFLGAGAYRHYVPAAVSEIASRSEFVTPYTPYQPEISQGTLQALFEYQSQICRLFDMDVSNASHYSGATATADAALMAIRIGKTRKEIIIPTNIHPEYRSVISTVLCHDSTVTTIPSHEGIVDRNELKKSVSKNTAAVLVQFPNFFGIVEDLKDVAEIAHNSGALLIAVVPEPVALGILTTPGKLGADIAVGEGLSLGLGTNFGGPTLGIFTTKKEFVRQMPGRVCGKTVDADGKTGYVLTLSTREQHIRREKATSNICSNQALCATTAAVYLSLVGKTGFKELAEINASKAIYAKKKLSETGARIKFHAKTFNEFVIECTKPAATILEKLSHDGIFGGVDLGSWYPEMKNCILVCVTELNSKDEIDRYADGLAEQSSPP